MQPVKSNWISVEPKYSRNEAYRYFLKIQYIVYKFFGLSPWNLNTCLLLRKTNQGNNEKVCKFSWIGSLYNVLVILIIVLADLYDRFTVYEFEGDDQSDDEDQEYYDFEPTPIYDSLLIKKEIIKLIGLCSIVFFYICSQRSMINAINRLNLIEKKLKRYDKFELKHISSYVIFIVNLIFSSGNILTIAIDNATREILIKTPPPVISSWIIIQYTLLMIDIEEKFKIVNLKIFRMTKCESISNNFEVVKNTYKELCDVCEEIANFYGIPVLASILYFSVECLYILHFIFTSSLQKPPPEFEDYYYDFSNFLWVVFLFLVLTSSVSRATSEVQFNFI